MQYWEIEDRPFGTCLTILPGWDLDVAHQFLQYMENNFDPTSIKRLLIDLSRVNHLNSMIIGIMVNISKRIRQSGGKIALFKPSESVQDPFADIGLLPHFLIFQTPEELERTFGTLPRIPHV